MTDCPRCHGTGEIVTDWSVYLEDGLSVDEAVSECPDCDGTGDADEDDGCCPGCGACPGFTGVDCDETCEWATIGGAKA